MENQNDALAGWLFVVAIVAIGVWQLPRVLKSLKWDSVRSSEPVDQPTVRERQDSVEVPQDAQSLDIEIDPVKMKMLHDRFRSQQNFVGGVIAGVVAAGIGAVLWAVITVTTEFQIGFMAVGVGFLVALAVRSVGKGIDNIFGLAGAALALIGCTAGNLLATCGLIAKHNDIPFFTVLSVLEWEAVKNLMVAGFSPIDLLFYAIAVYEGYKLSFRTLTSADLEDVLPSG